MVESITSGIMVGLLLHSKKSEPILEYFLIAVGNTI